MNDLHDLVPTDNYRLSPLPDNCSLEDVLDLLAGARTAQILRLLRAGPRRFGDLRRDLIKVSTKLLTNRLRVMQGQGLLERQVLPSNPPMVKYSLTQPSRELEPIVNRMEQLALINLITPRSPR